MVYKDKRKQLYKLRKKVINHMSGLTSEIGKINEVSSHPERDFAQIFKDESIYIGMLRALHDAYLTSFKSKMKLFSPENKDAIQLACASAGLKYPSDKQLSDRHYRARIQRSLERRKGKDGASYFEFFRLLSLRQKHDEVYRKQAIEERKKSVTCPKCGLEQKPVENYVMCENDRCRWQGAVIGNLYEGFSREEESNKLKEKEG